MKTITRNCDFCQEPYEAQVRYLNRGQGIYCSRLCSSKGSPAKRRKNHEPNLICTYCSKPFYRSASKQSSSRSGLFFCCREHKDLAQKLDGVKEIHPSHYGVEYARYRAKAFAFYPHECKNCGYNKYPEILEVNHIDCDRSNNDISNLEILCPTCHSEYHFITQTGCWEKRTAEKAVVSL
jgi:5-methylcytosine-specific restriction endonuclease McrA